MYKHGGVLQAHTHSGHAFNILDQEISEKN